ncbi:transmembrane protein 64-like isoform X6 [Homarus americanus]|nr:transmembrane protein 64-like isoform X6 [Homarus americanus]
MFGTWRGLAVTLSTATAGVFLAHILIRVCLREVVHRRVVTSRLLRALLAVLGGPQAFKVVFVTRLTPIPFGLQNAVFAVSRVPTWLYLAATVVGLLPTQVLNCYLGTTVRNLDDVVSQSPSASATGWGVFAVQIVISIGLTMWVVRRAKAELHKTMAAQLSDDTQPTLCSPAHSTRTPTNSATHTPAHTPAHTPSRASSRTSNGHANFPVDIASSHLTKITGVNYGYDDDDVVGGNGADDELILAAGVSPNTSLSTSTIITTSNTSSFSLRTTSSTNTTTTSTTTFRRDSADDIFILVDSPA